EPILDDLTQRGKQIREILDAHNIFSLNIMASPGAGKTSLIIQTILKLQQNYRIAVIEGDIVPIDVEKIQKLDIPVVLAHTGGSCHLDSIMMEKAIQKLSLNTLDLIIVENVGNLICPANFYLGTHKNVVIASVPEGDDKPYKYPGIFRGADVIVLNKIDYRDREDFSMDNFMHGVSLVNTSTEIIRLSCKTGENFSQWIDWIEKHCKGLENK
ncbi:MAG: hydrogenase nickel incorporation protein HypB, partial [Candidatus Calescibacterium sp.]|nr:hydrogenase nickel incorporation protein HypB [Candidatus Calescibacterium sp.]